MPRHRYYADTPCSVPGCTERPRANGYCEMHFSRLRRRGTTDDRVSPTTCAVAWCNHAGPYVRGYCPPHYQQWRRGTLEGGAA